MDEEFAPNDGLDGLQDVGYLDTWETFDAYFARHHNDVGEIDGLDDDGAPHSLTLQEIVKEELELTRSAYQLSKMYGGYDGGFAAPGIVSPTKPTVKNGMMHCIKMLRKIVIKDYDDGVTPNFAAIPVILRRIQELLHAYYKFKVTGVRTPELMFCDFPSIFSVSYVLHEVGLTLQLDPPRLEVLMNEVGPQLEEMLFDDAHIIGRSRLSVIELQEVMSYRAELNADDENTIGRMMEMSEKDMAAYASVYFYADVMIGFLMTAGTTEDQRRRERKSLQKLVHWTTNNNMRAVFGDTLTDSLRSVYRDESLLIKFCRAGGIGGLMFDCTMTACSSMAQKAVRSLPEAAWEAHTSTALLNTTRSMAEIKKVQNSWKPLDLMILGCHNIYKNYGITPFIEASETMGWEEAMFYSYLAHQFQQRGLPRQSEDEIRALYEEFDDSPLDIKARCRWAALNRAGRWDFLELYGCDNEECCERADYLRLRTIKAFRDEKTETRLYEWGQGMISCEACHAANYCSSKCREIALSSHAGACARAQEGPAHAHGPWQDMLAGLAAEQFEEPF
ncbi:hypothetical protein SISNIDRAFT_458613 [Sistotremastrum niveocremeum HHB9708]|uniref:MYND-type domain-containing protein n=1 Tax=Sistotremastrum niveocremeum HHB9708 TaxID=1314777 RepID=A0A164QHC6_9AGAM|nr:hypothetical protein SISNIDRAFT_458613 [Sistotremastrum niveocremeum HHB9708]